MKLLIALIMFCGVFLEAKAFEKPKFHFCRPNSTKISCQLQLALVCGTGYIDGCLTQQTNTHRCVLKNEGVSCDTPLQILCVAGFRDGCENGRSDRHQCVPVPGPSCSMSFDCPEGFHDTCDQ